MERAILICDTLRIRHVPNDRRGILEIYVEGAELMESEIIDRPYGWRCDRNGGGSEGDRSPSMLEIMTKSIDRDDPSRKERYLKTLSCQNYTISEEGDDRHITLL